MEKQVLNSKLCMPEFSNAFMKRDRLVERIHAFTEQVIVLHAGSGYGKTEIMTEYIQRYQEPFIWYQLDRLDNDSKTFFSYLEVSFQKHIDSFRLDWDSINQTSEEMEFVAKQVLRQLEIWDNSITIILDDFQTIKNERLYDFWSCFIRYMNQNVKLFILTKEGFPGYLTRFLLQGRIGVLAKSDLKMSKEELLDNLNYIEINMGNISQEPCDLVERILGYSEGWIVAINDFIRMQKQEETIRYKSGIFDFILYEIWNPLSAKYRTFMKESAVLNTVTPEVCDSIFEMNHAEDILEFFVEQQLLVEREKNQIYHYHPILKHFLDCRLEDDEREKIQQRESEFYNIRNKESLSVILPNVITPKTVGYRQTKISFSETERKCVFSCLGGIRIYDVERGTTIRWRTRKAKEMFCYLWEHRDRPLTKEEIIEALWEEADGQKIESLFHTTLSYLKRSFTEFGMADVIQVNNKKYIINAQFFHSDIQQLQVLCERWEKGLVMKEIEKEYQKLNQIYQGEYMEEIDNFWVISKREYYRKQYLKCCKILVERAMEQEQQDLAVQILERAIELDPYSEELHGMLLEGLGALGELRLAKQCYDNYTRLLREDLNITIGRRVQESYQKNILRRSG